MDASLVRICEATLHVQVAWGSAGRRPKRRNYVMADFSGIGIWEVLEGDVHLAHADGRREHLGPGSIYLNSRGAPDQVLVPHPERTRVRGADLIATVLGGVQLTQLVVPPALPDPGLAATLHGLLPDLARAPQDLPQVLLRRAAAAQAVAGALAAGTPTAACARWGGDVHRLQPALEAIRRSPSRPVRLDQLARLCGLQRSRFAELFRGCFGEAPMDWVRQVRLRDAQERLLDPEATVAAVASAVGYPDPFHFSRVFKAHLGLSPMAWRRRQLAERSG
jgi:AraC-like DNA-binding protein